MKKIFLLTLPILLLSGCATTTERPNAEMMAVSGSKGDAIIKVGYLQRGTEYGMVEYIENWNSANDLALKKCQTWGYMNAEAFNDLVKSEECELKNSYLTGKPYCSQRIVSKEYQCFN